MLTTIGGKNLNYEQLGEGEHILFVHGWGGSMKSLHALHLLASKEFRSTIIDLPGFGASDNPDPEWGVAEYALHITTFMKELGITKFHYFGHSFGGAVGIYIASHMPECIDKLIVCNSAFKRDSEKSDNSSGLISKIKEISFLKPYLPQLKTMYYKIFHPNSDILVAPHLESNFKKIVTEDLTPLISTIHAKTLILWGEQDSVTPVEWAHELHGKIQGSELKLFPLARHGLPIKQPEEVYRQIAEFINKR